MTGRFHIRMLEHKNRYNRDTSGGIIEGKFDTKDEAKLCEKQLHDKGYLGEWEGYKKTDYKVRSKKRNKSIIQYTLEGEFIRDWDSIKQAKSNPGFGNSISRCLRGKQKQAYGYKWEYKTNQH